MHIFELYTMKKKLILKKNISGCRSPLNDSTIIHTYAIKIVYSTLVHITLLPGFFKYLQQVRSRSVFTILSDPKLQHCEDGIMDIATD